MITSGQYKVGNEFLIQKSVWKLVLHLHIDVKPKKIKIFIMAAGGHIWYGNYAIRGGVAGKHLGDFSWPVTH